MERDPKNLAGFCGLYCGACGIYQGKIKHAVENLRQVIGAYGFDKAAPQLANWEPTFRNYPEFEKVLDGFIRLFSDCPGCVAGGGDPSCTIRECCKQKAYETCAECTVLPTCEKAKRHAISIDEMQRIKAMGVEKWAEQMRRKVDMGYCYLDKR